VADLINKFEGLMEKYGYADIKGLCGAAAQLMNMPREVSAERVRRLGEAYRERAVDADKCTGCGRCVDACWHEGIEISEGKAKKTACCIGCGYCFAVCPTKALDVNVGDVLAGAYE
jgi:heterodisulfide reductase subunit A-like polyferredoxin